MWKVNGTILQMAEGDYGVALPVTVSGATLGASDTIKFTFKSALGGTAILEKVYAAPSPEPLRMGEASAPNTVNLEFTEAESALFAVGVYVYSMDWYQDGNFLCNIIPAGIFKVVDKA